MAQYEIPPEEYTFECVLPPNDESIEWHELPEYLHAKKHCEHLIHNAARRASHHHHSVEVIDNDKEIGASSIELLGGAAITWDLEAGGSVPILRYLTMHIKDLDKFLNFEVVVLDEEMKQRVFKVSNKRSHAVISNEKKRDADGNEVEYSVCTLPLAIDKGWQMTCLDLVDLCKNAFGTSKPNTLSITVRGECRISKIFFHNEKYSDAEMPPHLRCIG